MARDADMNIISAHLAFSSGRNNDYNAVQVWATKGGNRYLLDQVHKRADLSQILGDIRTLKVK